MTVIANDGIALINISIERRVVNIMKIDKKVNLWIPGGIGWSNQERVKDLLKDDKKINDVMFYNFGFIPEKVVSLDSISEWRELSNLVKYLGWGRYLYFNFFRENMIFNNEIISTLMEDNFNKLSEVMVRDFVESDMFENDDTKISIVNTTSQNGLASFIGNRIEWLGGLVISVGNEKKDMNENCILQKSDLRKDLWWDDELKKLFDCKIEINNSLSEDQIELYFGDKFSEMIKYNSYVRTF